MPKYKTISLPGHGRPLSIKFKDDDPLFAQVSEMTSGQVRAALGIGTFAELEREAARRRLAPHGFVHEKLREVYARATPVPLYSGWPEGSLEATRDARELLLAVKAKRVLDPFAGRANYAAAAAQSTSMRAWYCEVSPVFQEIARARNRALASSPEVRKAMADELRALGEGLERSVMREAPDALLQASRAAHFDIDAADPASIELLERVRTAIDRMGIAAPLAAAAVVEALPRVLSDLAYDRLVRDLRREVRSAAAFAIGEEALHSLPLCVGDDVTRLADLVPLGFDCVLTDPPSLNFVAYTLPLATWFLGLRRARPSRSRDTAGALAAIPAAARRRIAKDVAAIADPRMARIVANYFADMTAALAACERHLTKRATIAFEVKSSTIAGRRVDTPMHLLDIVRTFGFEPSAVESERFQVLQRA